MEKMRFEGKVVIVTGASSGHRPLHRAAVRHGGCQGRRRGAPPEAAGRPARQVAAENAPGVILPVKTDVRDPAQIDAMFDTCLKEFGHLDILVNNAGMLDGQLPIHETPQEVYDMIYETNQRAVYLCCQRAIKIFLEQGTPANIVNVASAASLRGLKGGAMYVMTKHAVLGLTRNISASSSSAASAATASSPRTSSPRSTRCRAKRASASSSGRCAPARRPRCTPSRSPARKKPMLGKPKDCANAIAYLADDVRRALHLRCGAEGGRRLAQHVPLPRNVLRKET